MAAPRPTPTVIRLAKGNPGKRPINDKEPKPEKGIPTAPKWLSPTAKAAWREMCKHLDRMGVLTKADGKALEALVDSYAEWREARAIVAAEGMTYTTTTQSGDLMQRAHPAVAIASDAWRRFLRGLLEFGLTPAARSKVKSEGEAPEDEIASFFG